MIRVIFLFVFITSQLSSQDSVKNKQDFISIRGLPYPNLYLFLLGGGLVLEVEKNITPTHSICLGAKYSIMGGFFGLSLNYKVLMFEYRYYPKNSNLNSKKYISPYIKLRSMVYTEFGSDYLNYTENSLGFGLTYGWKKNNLNPFFGAGYFIGFNEQGIQNNPFIISNRKPDPLYTDFDLRIGLMLGINFKK